MELWYKALKNTLPPEKYEVNALHTLMQQEVTGWRRCEKRQRCGEYGKQTCYEKIIKNDDGNDEDEFMDTDGSNLPFH